MRRFGALALALALALVMTTSARAQGVPPPFPTPLPRATPIALPGVTIMRLPDLSRGAARITRTERKLRHPFLRAVGEATVTDGTLAERYAARKALYARRAAQAKAILARARSVQTVLLRQPR